MEYDFLTRLQKGESITDIADEITTALNKANESYAKEQEEKRKVDTERANKIALADELLCAFIDLLNLYDVDTEPFDDITSEDVIDLFDEIVPVVKAYAGFYEALHGVDKAKDATECKCENKSCSTDPIADFLKKFVD